MYNQHHNFDRKGRWDFDGLDIVAVIQNGDLAAVRDVIDKYGIHRIPGSCTLLCTALKFSREDIAKLLVAKGADVNPDPNPKLKRGSPSSVDTPLHHAVHARDEEIMESLIQRGALLNAKAGNRNSTALFEAVFYRKAHIMKILLRHGADVNIPRGNGETPLECAVERGVPLTQMLLEHGADPNNALHHAAKVGKLDVMKLLLTYGANINLIPHNNTTPLHIAVEYRHGQLVEYLLKHGADVNAQDIFFSDQSVLCTAVEAGDPVIVNIVLSHRPNLRNKENQNAVRIALRNQKATKQGHVYGEIIENLLSYGFTIPSEDANNPQLLFVAIRNAYVKTVGELLNRGTNLKVLRNSILSDVLPLYPTTLSNRSKLATVLVKYGADEHTRCTMGLRPRKWSMLRKMDLSMFELLLTDRGSVKNNPDLLKLAVWHGHVEIVECLLRHGVDVDAQDASGRTALHFCVLRRKNTLNPLLQRHRSALKVDKEIVKVLLSRGANANATTTTGETPLHLAAQNNLVEIIETLVNAGVQVNAADGQGTTALHHLARTGNFKISEFLLLKGADVNASGKDSLTPLHIACKSGFLEIVQLLVEYGANINSQSKTGTPLHVACLDGHANVVRYLVEYGADVNVTTVDDSTPLEQSIERIDAVRPKSTYTLTRDFLLRHLTKMKAANLFLSEKNLPYTGPCFIEAIQREGFWVGVCNPPFFEPSRYHFKCEEEVAAMKCDKIEDSNFSFYDVLVGSEERIIKLSANENLAQVVKTDDFETRYPNYASLIKGRVRKGSRLRALREECSQVLFDIAPPLPHLCIERIIAYLSVVDLRILASVRECPT